jgi:hypothetical protein
MLPQYRSASSLVLVLLVVAVSVAGCDSNDPETGPFFVRFTASGSQVQFNTVNTIWGAFGSSDSQHNGVFTAFTESSNISIQVYDRSPIVEATYSGYSIDQGALIGMLIAYQNPAGVTFTSGATPSADTRVVITQISTTAVRGTFQGTLRATGQPDLVVTGGEFHVQRTP